MNHHQFKTRYSISKDIGIPANMRLYIHHTFYDGQGHIKEYVRSTLASREVRELPGYSDVQILLGALWSAMTGDSGQDILEVLAINSEPNPEVYSWVFKGKEYDEAERMISCGIGTVLFGEEMKRWISSSRNPEDFLNNPPHIAGFENLHDIKITD